jgi:hypothetical protein
VLLIFQLHQTPENCARAILMRFKAEYFCTFGKTKIYVTG